MPKTITADVPEHWLSNALIGMKMNFGMDIPFGVSKSGVIRAALAAVADKTPDEIRQHATGSSSNMTSGGKSAIGAQVPEDLLLEGLQKVSEGKGKSAEISFTVRVGLVMLATGCSRQEAEAWAEMKRGRPVKNREIAA